jgi:hypothetical protein
MLEIIWWNYLYLQLYFSSFSPTKAIGKIRKKEKNAVLFSLLLLIVFL